MEFFSLRVKKAFIYLQKAFIKASILHYFDLEHYIHIETNTLEYAINDIRSQMTLDQLDQLFSHHMTHKNLDLNFFKSEIS